LSEAQRAILAMPLQERLARLSEDQILAYTDWHAVDLATVVDTRFDEAAQRVAQPGVNVTDRDGPSRLVMCTYAHVAAVWGRARVLRRLAARGADLNARCISKGTFEYASVTPLHLAVLLRRNEAVLALLQLGADTSLRTHSRHTSEEDAAAMAASMHHWELLNMLLDHGAPCNRPYDGASPLHYAAGLGQHALVRRLLDCGAMIDARSHWGEGDTPLHVAAEHGQMETVRELLRRGARYLISQDGRGPLDLAEEGGHSEIAALLRPLHAPATRAFEAERNRLSEEAEKTNAEESAKAAQLAPPRAPHAPDTVTMQGQYDPYEGDTLEL
jgi:ankyrin repeat protein